MFKTVKNTNNYFQYKTTLWSTCCQSKFVWKTVESDKQILKEVRSQKINQKKTQAKFNHPLNKNIDKKYLKQIIKTPDLCQISLSVCLHTD